MKDISRYVNFFVKNIRYFKWLGHEIEFKYSTELKIIVINKELSLFLCWDVVIATSHPVLVKTY